jgi:DNA-binding ferritin-like protein
MELLKLAVIAQVLKQIAHIAHNNCSRTVFMQDHEFFGALYEQADDIYDSLIERHIGLTDQEVDLAPLLQQVVDKVKTIPTTNVKENKAYYVELLKIIHEFNAAASVIAKTASLGTNNLIAGHSDNLEVVVYKIKRRIKV